MTDPNTLTSFTIQNIAIILSLIAGSSILTWIAYLHKCLNLPIEKYPGPTISFREAAIFFCIFLGIYFLSPILIYKLYMQFPHLSNHQAVLIPILQSTIYLTTAVFLFLYAYYENPFAIKRICKDRLYPPSTPILTDFKMGLIFFVISFPLILAVAELAEIITNLIFGQVETDQNAVLYLKIALKSPLGLFFSLLSVLVFAPILEEFLFRGILQTWLRNKLGTVSAILLSSLFFSLMHFSPTQSTTNVPLLITLFTLSLYLGFLYEKTRSLFACIILHVTFNSLSVIRIIFTEA